jgi:hypothetical protein
MMKSRKMRWAGHVARMVKKNAYRLLVGKPEGNNHKKDQNMSGWILER